jgi:hypothetical protein
VTPLDPIDRVDGALRPRVDGIRPVQRRLDRRDDEPQGRREPPREEGEGDGDGDPSDEGHVDVRV